MRVVHKRIGQGHSVKTHGKARSPGWPHVRRDFLAKHPKCVVCGGTKKLEVHHVLPFHLHPELELVGSNLITLCEGHTGDVNCHLFVGHLMNFSSFNKDVRANAAYWRSKIKRRPGGC